MVEWRRITLIHNLKQQCLNNFSLVLKKPLTSESEEIIQKKMDLKIGNIIIENGNEFLRFKKIFFCDFNFFWFL